MRCHFAGHDVLDVAEEVGLGFAGYRVLNRAHNAGDIGVGISRGLLEGIGSALAGLTGTENPEPQASASSRKKLTPKKTSAAAKSTTAKNTATATKSTTTKKAATAAKSTTTKKAATAAKSTTAKKTSSTKAASGKKTLKGTNP